MSMSQQESSELSKPGAGSFDDPTALEAPPLPFALVTVLSAVLSVQSGQLDGAPFQHLTKRIRAVGAISDDPSRLSPRVAFGAGDADRSARSLRKSNFSQKGTFQPSTQRKTLTIRRRHPIRFLIEADVAECEASVWAEAKPPSRRGLEHGGIPSPSKTPSGDSQASSLRFCGSHCFKLRRQIAGDRYLLSRRRHTGRAERPLGLPPMQSWFDAFKRPQMSRQHVGSYNSGSMRECRAFVNESNQHLLNCQASHTQTSVRRCLSGG